MLSSIHPLGERARNNRWIVTAAAFSIAALGAGALAGAVIAGAGSLVPEGNWRWVAAAGAVTGAGILDLSGVNPPGPRRQVNEDWIGAFRGWVYGAGFGAQLGLGAATYVVTWSVWAVAAVAFLSGRATAGAVIGAAFGLGRSVFPLAAGWIDRPSRLTSFNRKMAGWAWPASRALAVTCVVVGSLGFAMGWL